MSQRSGNVGNRTKASPQGQSPAKGGGSGRSRARYDRRQEEVTDIAARVFAERGFHATTINDLVEATGLQRGGLYHYISGKNDLLIRIHQTFLDPLLAEASEVPVSEPPDVALRRLAQILMRYHVDYHYHITVFLNEWRTISTQPVWSEIRGERRKFEKIIERVLQRGLDEGVFVIADIRHAVLAWLGMINYSYQWMNPKGKVPPASLADEFSDIFLNGIRARGQKGAVGRKRG